MTSASASRPPPIQDPSSYVKVNQTAKAKANMPASTSGKASANDKVLEGIDTLQRTLPGTQIDLLLQEAKATFKLTMQAFKGLGGTLSDAWNQPGKWYVQFAKVFGAGIGALLCGGGLLVSAAAKVLWAPTLLLSSLWGILQAGREIPNKSLTSFKEGFSRGFDEAFEKTEWINTFLQTVGATITAPLSLLEVLGNRLANYCALGGTKTQATDIAKRREKIEYAIYHLEPIATPNVFIHALEKARTAGNINFERLQQELTTLNELGVNFGSREFGSLITVLSYGAMVGPLSDKKEQEANTNMTELAKIINNLKVGDQLNRQNRMLLKLDQKSK